MNRDYWAEAIRNVRTRRQARASGRTPLVCRLFGHQWMGPWSISDHHPWCSRCGLWSER